VLKSRDHDEIVFWIGLIGHIRLIFSFPASATAHGRAFP
jgi:hypothetical protein